MKNAGIGISVVTILLFDKAQAKKALVAKAATGNAAPGGKNL